MASEAVISFLEAKAIKVTPVRILVLKLLLASKNGMAANEIEKELFYCDRITIYRTLVTFVEKGVLHAVLNPAGLKNYMLCSDTCKIHQHNDNHPHFYCEKCQKTSCIETVNVPIIQLGEAYKVNEIQIAIKGICKDCNTVA